MELKFGTVKMGLSPRLELDSVGNDEDDKEEGRAVEGGGGGTTTLVDAGAGGPESTRPTKLSVILLVMKGGCTQK